MCVCARVCVCMHDVELHQSGQIQPMAVANSSYNSQKCDRKSVQSAFSIAPNGLLVVGQFDIDGTDRNTIPWCLRQISLRVLGLGLPAMAPHIETFKLTTNL